MGTTCTSQLITKPLRLAHKKRGLDAQKAARLLWRALNVTMNFEKAHKSYNNAAFATYLWLGSFVVPIVFPFELPVTDSVKGINIMLVPALLAGAYYAPGIIRSGVRSDVAVFIVVPVLLILVMGCLRAFNI